MISETREVLMESWHKLDGVVRWKNRNGWIVLQIHHSADPVKDDPWANKAAEKYPLGRNGKYWAAEMDLDAGALSGTLVYETFSRAKHVVNINMRDAIEWSRFIIIDPGWQNPCAVLFCAMDGDGTRYVCDEIYVKKKNVQEIAQLIRYKRAKYGWIEETDFNLIGRDAFAETQSAAGKTIATQFAEDGVTVNPADTRVEAGIMAVSQALAVRGNGEPGLKIATRCENTIWEMENYRYEDVSEEEAMLKSLKEKPLKLNDHAMDCVRYFVVGVPNGYGSSGPTPDHNTAAEMRKRGIRHSLRLQQVRDYEHDDDDLYGELYD